MSNVWMPRKKLTVRFDEKILDAIREVAEESNSSSNNWLETHLIHFFKSSGKLPPDFKAEPDKRGGSRKKRGSDDD